MKTTLLTLALLLATPALAQSSDSPLPAPDPNAVVSLSIAEVDRLIDAEIKRHDADLAQAGIADILAKLRTQSAPAAHGAEDKK